MTPVALSVVRRLLAREWAFKILVNVLGVSISTFGYHRSERRNYSGGGGREGQPTPGHSTRGDSKQPHQKYFLRLTNTKVSMIKSAE